MVDICIIFSIWLFGTVFSTCFLLDYAKIVHNDAFISLFVIDTLLIGFRNSRQGASRYFCSYNSQIMKKLTTLNKKQMQNTFFCAFRQS